MSTLQRFPPTYLYYIRTNDTPSYQRHRDEKARLQPITLHNSTHHMPRQALHKATALFSSPTQLRSRTMANPMLTAGERRKTVLGEYAPQKNNLLPYTPREKVAGGLSYGVGHFPTPHQKKKPIYSHPTLLHNINCEAFSTQADSYKEMTSTARKKNYPPVAILSPGRLSRSAGAQAESKKGDDGDISRILSSLTSSWRWKLYPCLMQKMPSYVSKNFYHFHTVICANMS